MLFLFFISFHISFLLSLSWIKYLVTKLKKKIDNRINFGNNNLIFTNLICHLK